MIVKIDVCMQKMCGPQSTKIEGKRLLLKLAVQIKKKKAGIGS